MIRRFLSHIIHIILTKVLPVEPKKQFKYLFTFTILIKDWIPREGSSSHFFYLWNRITVPSQSSGMLSFSSPLRALNEWLVATCIQPIILARMSSTVRRKYYNARWLWVITLTMYTSIPSFAIIAASDILVTIPPVVSWAATVNSTVYEVLQFIYENVSVFLFLLGTYSLQLLNSKFDVS